MFEKGSVSLQSELIGKNNPLNKRINEKDISYAPTILQQGRFFNR